MEFTNDEMDLLHHSRNFGGIRHGFHNPVHSSNQAIPNSNIPSSSHIASAIENVGVEESKLPQGGNIASQGYVLQETSSNIDALNDPDRDCLMATPSSSRHNSHSASDANYCQCQGDARTSGNRAGNSRAPPLRQVSHSRLPSIAMMLNDPPSSHASIHPTGNPPMPKSRFGNRMSISNASDSTIVPPISIPEQRYFLLNTLYQICLDATTTYIRTLPHSSRNGLQYERRRSYSNRYHPYRGRGRERSYNDDGSKTLMDNIEVISTFLWRKARSDEMAPHRAESDAVMDMKNLYRWGENLVDGLEERAGNEEARTAVSHAAMSLCSWLRVREACNLCTEVEEELRDLTNVEREREGEAGDEFGDRL